MRILLTSHAYVEPGYHAKLTRLAELPDLQLCVVIPMKWKDSLFAYGETHAQGKYTLVALPTFGFSNANAFLYRANLRELLRHFNPDILHIEQEPRSTVTMQWLLANSGRSKTIIFTWENTAQPWRMPQSFFEYYALRCAQAFIGGNRQAVELLGAKGWHGPAWVLPQMGVAIPDTPSRPVTGKNEIGNELVVGFVGRLIDEKGIRDLVQAVECLPDVRLVCLGSGVLADWLASVPNVTVFPPVPHARVSEFLSALDVLVLPSHTTPRWKEQFGRVLIEAMSCGVPVVGSNSGAIPEVIGDAGLIFPEGDVNALSECLIRLRDERGLRAELSAKGRARVLVHYTHERIANQTVAIYRQLGVE